MGRNCYHRALRTRFLFRLAVLALSPALPIWGFMHIVQLSGVLFGGLVVSVLVWAFVELIGSLVETYVQFIAERNRFFIMVQEYWHQLWQLL